MTNKIKIVLKAITDKIAGTPPRNTVKNTKLSTSLVLSARSYLNMDPQCLNHIHDSINTVIIHSKQQTDSYDEKANENDEEEKKSPENIHVNSSTQPDLLVAFITKKVLKFNSFFESLGQVPQSSDTEVVCTKGDDGEVMFIEIIRNNDDSREDGPEEEGNLTYVIDFIIVKDISSIIEPRLLQVVLGKPFVKISNMTHDPPQGVVTFNNG
nr:MAK10-like protein [Tanacetum cinerariifolium]